MNKVNKKKITLNLEEEKQFARNLEQSSSCNTEKSGIAISNNMCYNIITLALQNYHLYASLPKATRCDINNGLLITPRFLTEAMLRSSLTNKVVYRGQNIMK